MIVVTLLYSFSSDYVLTGSKGQNPTGRAHRWQSWTSPHPQLWLKCLGPLYFYSSSNVFWTTPKCIARVIGFIFMLPVHICVFQPHVFFLRRVLHLAAYKCFWPHRLTVAAENAEFFCLGKCIFFCQPTTALFLDGQNKELDTIHQKLR